MKHFINISLIVILTIGSLNAQTIIPDSTFVSGTWTKTSSPYIIEGAAIVRVNETLTIEPGVEVRFDTVSDFSALSESFDGTALIVRGVLEAIGTAQEKILFTRNGETGYWGNIQIKTEQESQSTIKNCIVEYANYLEYSDAYNNPEDSYGGINILLPSFDPDNPRLLLDSTIIRYCGRNGVYLYFCSALIMNSEIHHNNSDGIYCNDGSRPTIADNTIQNNAQNGIYVYFNSVPKIINNLISNNNSGIWTLGDSHINQNIIENNTENGLCCAVISWHSMSATNNKLIGNNINLYVRNGNIDAVNNLIQDAGEWAVYIMSESTMNSLNQTIVNNNRGFKLFVRCNANLTNTICWDNGSDENGGSITLKNSLWDSTTLDEGMVGLGENILGLDPLFADTAIGDYSLLGTSPAINMGYIDTSDLNIPDYDLAGNPRISNGRIDVGAYEFQLYDEYVRLIYPYQEPYIVSNLWDTIRWSSSRPEDGTDILLSTDNGSTWNVIQSDIISDEYAWLVPELIADSCLLLIRNSLDHSIADTSRYLFRISPNYIPGGILVYGTWEKTYSPYKVFGPIEIPVGSSLVIDPGVNVLFAEETAPTNYIYKTGGSITANGKIIAEGTPEELILFTCMDSTSYWGNITAHSYNYVDSSIFKYCIFEYGGHGRNGVVDIRYGYTFMNNIVRYNYRNGLHIDRYIKNSPISNCQFYGNTEFGVNVYILTVVAGYDAFLNNCTFHANKGAIRSNGYSTILNNSIFSSTTEYQNKLNSQYQDFEVNYCLFDWILETDNIASYTGLILNSDPKYINAAGGDFHLRRNSPAIDAGNPSDDYSFEPEPNGDRINMGAYGNTNEAALSPLFTLSRYDISAMGHDTIMLYKNDLGEEIGSGQIMVGDSIVHISQWTNDSIEFVTPVILPGSWDVHLTASDGSAYLMDDFIVSHAPQVGEVVPFHGQIAGGEDVEMKGNYLGWLQQRLLIDSITCTITHWTDTLIRFQTPPHGEGTVDIILATDELIYSDTLFNSFQYFSEEPENLCIVFPDTLKSGRNYILSCPVIIEENRTVIIEPGVTIYANSAENQSLPSIKVDGTLYSLGTVSSPVTFTSVPAGPGNWEGLILKNEAQINYTHVEFAVNGIKCESSNILVEYSYISNCSESGVFWNADEATASGILRNSEITDNSGWGIICQSSCFDYGAMASPEISRNQVSFNKMGGISLSAFGTVPYTGGSRRTATTSPLITNNRISGNYGFAVQAKAMGEHADGVVGSMNRYGRVKPELIQNVIEDNSGIIATDEWFENSTIEIEILNNTLVNNGKKLVKYNGGNIYTRNSILWEEDPDFPDINPFVKASYCNSNQVLNGEGNISSDPLFMDISNQNYTLTSSSPCIDAGSNQYVNFERDFDSKFRIWDGNLDTDTIVDIGAYEFGSPCYINTEQVTICEGESYEGWTESGTYHRTLTAITGCDSLVTTVLSVIPLPDKPLISQNGLILNSSSAEGNQWFLDGVQIPDATRQQYTPTQSGNYSVQVTISGCISEMSDTVAFNITTDEQLSIESIMVIPNPTSGEFEISGLPDNRSVQIEILSFDGRTIQSRTSNFATETVLNIAKHAPGIYLLVIDKQKSQSVKLIKY